MEKIYSWGVNYDDQLGREHKPSNNGRELWSGYHPPGIAAGGALNEQQVEKLAFGKAHSVAISADRNSIFVWYDDIRRVFVHSVATLTKFCLVFFSFVQGGQASTGQWVLVAVAISPTKK